MRIVLTLSRAAGKSVDLAVTVDGNATVSDLAGELQACDPNRPAKKGRRTLQTAGPQGRTLEADALVVESGLLPGDTVSLTPVPKRFVVKAVDAAARLHVLAGPDKGSVLPLAAGTFYLGRGAECEARVSDSSVSRRHAKLLVGDTLEVVEAGSSNGILVGGSTVERAVLANGDRFQVGDTEIAVELVPTATALPGHAVEESLVAFNRSPVLAPQHAGPTLTVPEPPQRQTGQRFPVIALIAPLIFGVVLFAVTRSPTSLIFVALSPVMAVGNVLEQRFSAKRGYNAAVTAFTAELAEVQEQGRAAAAEEGDRRRAEHPATNDVMAAATSRAPMLWSRRPTGERFLQVRLGLAADESRTEVKLPSTRQCEPELWQQLQDVQQSLATVPDVPVVADLATAPVGIAGPGRTSSDTARAVLAQVVGLHSPAEVVVAAFLDARDLVDWTWLLWVPHTSSPHSPLTSRHLASTAATVPKLLSELEDLVTARQAAEDDNSPAVVVLVQDSAQFDRTRMVALAARGPEAGVHVLWQAGRVQDLPAVCKTFLEMSPAPNGGSVGFVASGERRGPAVPETASAAALLSMARSLAPVVDSGAPLDDTSDLPRETSWVTLHGGTEGATVERILERWQESHSVMTGPYAKPPTRRHRGSLRAVVGGRATEPHVLDLRSHGPHALVGGTTGSGKSELLQSWILGLAAAHSPQRVTFLLVDYKGGSAFKDCLALPHTVGLVTDLSPHLVRRALTSLAAELRFREHLLAEHKAKDLAELEATGHTSTPPSLVIVVDEFAALVNEVPEFVDGVVNVAQRGRSLGLHLILATQRPAGVIKDNLRANTNLRLALRMADLEDSTDVLGSPVAASFDPEIPGRAMSKTGPGRLVAFQSAYAGGWTSDTPPPPQMVIEELTLGDPRRWERPESDEPVEAADPGPTDIARVVATVGAAATTAKLPVARKPWLPELAPTFSLERLPSPRTDEALIFGVLDDPGNQAQPVVAFKPDVDGNLIVYGTGGSGKSTLLRSLATDSGFTSRGGPCQVYCLDFAARGLDMLQVLPHVGSVIRGNDDERLTRLLGQLRGVIDERAARYAAVNAGTIVDYRKLAQSPGESRILLLVDGVPAFRNAYEGGLQGRWFDLFVSIASEGRPVGVHVIMSADRPGSVPGSLAASVQRRIVMRMADPDDYGLMGEPGDVLTSASPPGRAMENGAEIQVASPGGSRNTLLQSQQLTRIAATLRAGGVEDAPPVRTLGERIPRASLPRALDGAPVLGVASSTLTSVALPTSGSFLVYGPEGSGRTTALRSIVDAVLAIDPATSTHYLGSSRSELYAQKGWATVAGISDEHTAVSPALVAQLSDVAAGRQLVVVEGLHELANSPSDQPITAIVKAALAAGHLVVGEGDSAGLLSGIGLVGLLKTSRCGIALQPEQGDGSVIKTDFPRVRRADFPVGRGLLARRGRTEVVQVALPDSAIDVEGSSAHSLVGS